MTDNGAVPLTNGVSGAQPYAFLEFDLCRRGNYENVELEEVIFRLPWLDCGLLHCCNVRSRSRQREGVGKNSYYDRGPIFPYKAKKQLK